LLSFSRMRSSEEHIGERNMESGSHAKWIWMAIQVIVLRREWIELNTQIISNSQMHTIIDAVKSTFHDQIQSNPKLNCNII
jgi:hypothetical protein